MKAKVTFHKLIQNKQNVTPSDPKQHYMLSEAFFTLDVGGKQYTDMSVVLRHPYGTDYAKEPIEAEKPIGSYKGNWNHNAFRDAAEDYYRSALDAAIRISPGSNIRMETNLNTLSKSYDLDIPE